MSNNHLKKERDKQKSKLFWQRLLAVLFALLVWQVAAMLINQSLLIASPFEVIRRLGTMVVLPGFWLSIGNSLLHIAGGFLLALLLGTVLAVAAGRFHWVEIMLWPFVLTIKSVPVVSFIIITLFFLKPYQLPTFISFLMVFPVIYSNLLQGIKSTDQKLLQMAQLFKVPWKRRLLYIYLPSIKPFLLSACSLGVGLAWKSGTAAEVIGLPKGAIGSMLYESKIYHDISALLAWTVVIVLLSVLCEKLFMLLLTRLFARLEKVKIK